VDLHLLQLAQTSDCGPHGRGGRGGKVPGASSDNHAAVIVSAAPDADSLSLHVFLSAEGTDVLGVLRDLHLLDGLSEGSAVPGTVLADNTGLLRSLSHVSFF